MAVRWHRSDLRGPDSAALAKAAAAGPVIPAFVLDPAVLAYASDRRVAALGDALRSLRNWYEDRGSGLRILEGAPASVLPDLAREVGANRVVWGRNYSRLARNRDATVSASLTEAGLSTEVVDDVLCHPPGTVTTQAGDAYVRFSPFYRSWRERERPPPVDPPDPDALASVAQSTSPPGGFEETDCAHPPVTRKRGLERLETFCSEPIYDYETTRDRPDLRGTSRLSAHLRWGTLGPREVHAAVDAATARAPSDEAATSCETFHRQLAWREFYTHVLAAHPHLPQENYRTTEAPIEWRNRPAELEAWKRGETGFPIVDAGMRQLAAGGFLHNRLRMIVASFLTKDMLVDWREGYAWFRDHLVDHEPANDAGGWQWAAGTGPDAQPYFHVFNPWTQAKRHDPEGVYIRRHVPELRDVPTDVIHGWGDRSAKERQSVAPGYPAPMLEHARRREEAIAAFEKARD